MHKEQRGYWDHPTRFDPEIGITYRQDFELTSHHHLHKQHMFLLVQIHPHNNLPDYSLNQSP